MSISDFFQTHHFTPVLDKNSRLRIGDVTSVTINRPALMALRSFLPHPLTISTGRLNQYPGRDTPLIIQIWSLKVSDLLFSDFHGQAHYKGLSVCSDGLGRNNRVGIRPDNRLVTTKVFFLSPQLMGINGVILYKEMLKESRKMRDYDLSQNNCIDHLIRPIQKAGMMLDFGSVSTPRRLSDFCEQMVKEGKGVLISPKKYTFYLKRNPVFSKIKQHIR